MSRPEYQGPPELYYNAPEAAKYSQSSRIIAIQSQITSRAIELLCLPSVESSGGSLLLDIGCGSGVSGERVTVEGHHWIGCDISTDMLDVALDREVDGDMILADMGAPLKFRPGTFDGAISISAVQWLCNADKSDRVPFRRALCFFKWVYNAMSRGARAVMQFYPDSPDQAELITAAALKAGFGGGLLVDYPNSTKAKKHFLVLWAGFTGTPQTMPSALTGQDIMTTSHQHEIANLNRQSRHTRQKKGKAAKKSLEWILKKKVQQEGRGKEVKKTTKYTGRKRTDKV
eukprot:GHVN01038581.1.p1 GENE.GHVN01038581.1~~GHVN01038581.1.p1  ORF type:complete len:287 (-),score=39.75 GHVN01038581.1:220-1080(-)